MCNSRSLCILNDAHLRSNNELVVARVELLNNFFKEAERAEGVFKSDVSTHVRA